MTTLLTSRTYNTADDKTLPRSWYAPSKLLGRYKSVVDVALIDTTSSSGDWSGYIVQKWGARSYVILFSQHNNWPRAGFTVYTDAGPRLSFIGSMDEAETCKIIAED